MNEQANNGTPSNAATPAFNESLSGAAPWRPPMLGAKPPEEPQIKPWRPELQSLQNNQAMVGETAGDGANPLGLTDGAMPGDDEMAMLAGGPGRLRVSLSRSNLLLFGLFLVGVGIVAFMSMKKGPQEVSAADKQAEQSVDVAIDKFLARHGEPQAGPQAPQPDPADARKLISDTRKIVDLFLSFASKNQVPLENLRTNPFRFGEADDSQQPAQDTAAIKAEEAARQKRIEQARANLRKLRLQTVISGPAGRQAMINSSIVKAGDSIDGFAVLEVQDRTVVLGCEGEKFTLDMDF